MRPERRAQLLANLAEIDTPTPNTWAPLQRLAHSKANTPTLADVDERARQLASTGAWTYEEAAVTIQSATGDPLPAGTYVGTWMPVSPVTGTFTMELTPEGQDQLATFGDPNSTYVGIGAPKPPPLVQALCPRHGRPLRGGVCHQCERAHR